MDQYLEVFIDNKPLDVDVDNVPLSLNFILEDDADFTKKKGSEALDVVTILSGKNAQAANSMQNVNVLDLSPGSIYETPRPALIRSKGYELLKGKALLKKATHDLLPKNAIWNFYGDNAEWSINLKDRTLHEFVNDKSFAFNHDVVIDSWQFDGTSEEKDFVFAPVRYGTPFGSGSSIHEGKDEVVTIYDLRPAISIYWLLVRAFRFAGFTINSTFLSTPYFQRLVMPWTWGAFNRLDNTVYDAFRFKANTPEADRETGDRNFYHVSLTRYIDLKPSNDATAGMFDNGGSPGNYQYATGGRPLYTYPVSAPSVVLGVFGVSIQFDWSANNGSDITLWVEWYRNGQRIKDEALASISSASIGRNQTLVEERTAYLETELNPGDQIEVRFFMRCFDSGLGRAIAKQYVTEYGLLYFKMAKNSLINLKNYNKFKNYQLLDLLSGVKHFFDLQFSTDNQKREVIIEPMFPYSTEDLEERTEGFLNFIAKDWSLIQDLSAESETELVSDIEREWLFNTKEDAADGGLKKMQDRYSAIVGQAKYVMPERCKQGRKELENRFFSTLMHVQMQSFGSVTGVVPQLPCIYPENISNTSSSENENVFAPKLAYYKGFVSGVGGFKFLLDDGTVQTYTSFPFMFSVNYLPGGELDPVLSYADQAIDNGSGGIVLATGLMKRFYWPRLAIYRHGRRYKSAFRLPISEVINSPFRRIIKINESLFVLTEINGFKPLDDDSTETLMWRWYPLTQADVDNSYPTTLSVVADTQNGSFDFKSIRHLILYSDLPK